VVKDIEVWVRTIFALQEVKGKEIAELMSGGVYVTSTVLAC
jgi:hypothetical protein